MLLLKERVQRGKKVRFTHCCDGQLWYETEDGFAFPVPLGEVGNSTFLAEDKAIIFMRYIRIHMNMIEKARSGGHDGDVDTGPEGLP